MSRGVSSGSLERGDLGETSDRAAGVCSRETGEKGKEEVKGRRGEEAGRGGRG